MSGSHQDIKSIMNEGKFIMIIKNGKTADRVGMNINKEFWVMSRGR
jgi:hypothetical protein